MTALASFAIGFLIGLWMSIRILRKQDKIDNDHGVTPINVNPRAFENPSAKLFDPNVAHSMDAKRWNDHAKEDLGYIPDPNVVAFENSCKQTLEAISLSDELYFDKFFKKK